MSSLNYISKLGATALLAIILYMHVCSVWCSLGSDCNHNQVNQQRQQSHSCCNTNDNTEDAQDCQEGHLTFFTSTGQYFVGFNSDFTKAFSFIQVFLKPELIVFFTEVHETLAEYNVFHPPPPKAGIRTLIKSFQI